MVGTSSWSSSSSCTSSLGSLVDDVVVACVVKAADTAVEGTCVKFLCSYGGRILPRHADGALRYVGGDNRVVSVDRSLPFHELQRNLREMCGWEAVCLRCQLPTEDLDALVSVTSDDDLTNLLEEYDAASRDRLQPLKIRAFLFPRTTTITTTPPTSTPLSRSPPAPSAPSPSASRTVHHAHYHHQTARAPSCASRLAAHQMSSPPALVFCCTSSSITTGTAARRGRNDIPSPECQQRHCGNSDQIENRPRSSICVPSNVTRM